MATSSNSKAPMETTSSASQPDTTAVIAAPPAFATASGSTPASAREYQTTMISNKLIGRGSYPKGVVSEAANVSKSGNVNEGSRLFSDFRIVKAHGSGSFGVVFLCEHKLDRICYAVKRIPVDADSKIPMEIFALARLHHPHIVRYHQVWTEDYVITGYTPPGTFESKEDRDEARTKRCYYIQMQNCSGNLKSYWEHNTFQLEKAWSIFIQILEAMNYAHMQGICHCDISADNILFDSDGDVRMCDFGLARFLDPNADRSKIAFDPLTSLGNSSYRAPELIESQTVSEKVDIYSMGILLVDVFDSGFTEVEKFPKRRALKNESELPTSLANESNDVKCLLLRMVAVNADERPLTSELLDAFSSKKQ